MKISVIINTYNEEKNIVRCLESVKWADEIVLVDMHSTDKTREFAKRYTNKIFLHEQSGYVEPARNFAIAKAHNEWILVIDADEEIPEKLAQTLQSLPTENAGISIVSLPRKNMIFGKWIQHSGWWPDHLVRFFKKGTVTWKDEIHSVPETNGNMLTLTGADNAILHHNYDSVSQFLHKNLEIYAAREAEELLEKGYVFDYADAIRFPLKEFLSRYFAREGYKDGFHGLVLGVLMAMYHIAVFLYLWEKKKFVDAQPQALRGLEKELGIAKKELTFWFTEKKIEQEKNALKKFHLQIKRKLRI